MGPRMVHHHGFLDELIMHNKTPAFELAFLIASNIRVKE
jgi:hypothetical protein